ncbi:rhomboid family intramembrane serine protease [Sinomicrobium soli]|uniref:rhomboid family intramembrane serine protease n=1 Tax=Sinomicrobium sp. N-1-3-6 TaxID=2219864 RepID=UPI000DCD18BF|nr:rhomboid family intramembrane serine protease [Sinomicrobium sp. N-1-3-6]RAV29853.1 rhomboid family intramembrane serine protease [Sinomicrobium sp. N-1-3-6]
MQDHKDFRFSLTTVLYPFLFVVLVWTIYWIQIRFAYDFTGYGILPRKLPGLAGIVCSPFLHGSVKHLYNNSLPLLILGSMLLHFYRQQSLKVLLYGTLLSGLLTWGIGRPAYHIGASGLIYMLFAFIFFKGIFTRHYRLVALSLLVVFVYGSMLWYVFPIDEEISWEGHLSGFLSGLILAICIKGSLPVPHKYEWEKEDYDEKNDPFLRHFDDEGNFVENPPSQEDEEDPVS